VGSPFSIVKGGTVRILYAVHGYGRGHATRTLAVMPELARRWTVLCMAGGDAYTAIWPDFPVVRIPTLRFAYHHGSGSVSNWLTLRHSLPAVLDLVSRGPVFETVREIVREFGPDVIISDAEVWSHRVAADLKIPRISFDHIGLLAYCRPEVEWQDRPAALFNAQCYRWLMGQPDRVLVSSFYPVRPCQPDIKIVGPLLRPAVRDLSPRRGDHVLAYFNQGKDQLRPTILKALAGAGCPVHVYGSDLGRPGRLPGGDQHRRESVNRRSALPPKAGLRHAGSMRGTAAKCGGRGTAGDRNAPLRSSVLRGAAAHFPGQSGFLCR